MRRPLALGLVLASVLALPVWTAACRMPFSCIGVADGCYADHGTWTDDESGDSCGHCEYPEYGSSPPPSYTRYDFDAAVDAAAQADAPSDEDAGDAAGD